MPFNVFLIPKDLKLNSYYPRFYSINDSDFFSVPDGSIVSPVIFFDFGDPSVTAFSWSGYVFLDNVTKPVCYNVTSNFGSSTLRQNMPFYPFCQRFCIFGDTKFYGLDDNPLEEGFIPQPYDVSYKPELKQGIKRNNGDYELNKITVTCTLRKEYVEWYLRRILEASYGSKSGFANSDALSDVLDRLEFRSTVSTADLDDNIVSAFTNMGNGFGYYFISKDTIDSCPLPTFLNNCVYTYLSKKKYSITSNSNVTIGDQTGETSSAKYGTGYHPRFDISFSDKLSKVFKDGFTVSEYNNFISHLSDYTFSFSVPLKNINVPKDWHNDLKLLNSVFTYQTDMKFLSNYNDSETKFSQVYGLKKDQVGSGKSNSLEDSTNITFKDTTLTYKSYLESIVRVNYWVDSHLFSFDSYPDYVPIKDGDGKDINTTGNPFDLDAKPPTPDHYTSVDKDGKETERTPEQERQHEKEKDLGKYDEKFDFSITNIKDLFNQNSDFFAFLTSCIKILPGSFLAILISFFGVMLAICVVKWIL